MTFNSLYWIPERAKRILAAGYKNFQFFVLDSNNNTYIYTHGTIYLSILCIGFPYVHRGIIAVPSCVLSILCIGFFNACWWNNEQMGYFQFFVLDSNEDWGLKTCCLMGLSILCIGFLNLGGIMIQIDIPLFQFFVLDSLDSREPNDGSSHTFNSLYWIPCTCRMSRSSCSPLAFQFFVLDSLSYTCMHSTIY